MAGKGDTYRPTDKAHALQCADVGHAPPDLHGKCLRCGARWFPLLPPMVPDPEYVPQQTEET